MAEKEMCPELQDPEDTFVETYRGDGIRWLIPWPLKEDFLLLDRVIIFQKADGRYCAAGEMTVTLRYQGHASGIMRGVDFLEGIAQTCGALLGHLHDYRAYQTVFREVGGRRITGDGDMKVVDIAFKETCPVGEMVTIRVSPLQVKSIKQRYVKVQGYGQAFLGEKEATNLIFVELVLLPSATQAG